MKYLPPSTRLFIAVTLTTILFASCGISTKFASRKYTKGYFVDVPGSLKQPESKAANYAVSASNPVSEKANNNPLPKNETHCTQHTIESEPILQQQQAPRNLITTVESNEQQSVFEELQDTSKSETTMPYAAQADDNKSGETNYDVTARVLLITGLAVGLLGSLLGFLSAFVVGLFAILIIFGAIFLGCILLFIGLLFAIAAVIHHEKNPIASYILFGLATIGLVIFVIALARNDI